MGIEGVVSEEGVIELRGHHIPRFHYYITVCLCTKESSFDKFASRFGFFTPEALETEFQLYSVLIETPYLKIKIVDQPDFLCKNICPVYLKDKYLSMNSLEKFVLNFSVPLITGKCSGEAHLFTRLGDRLYVHGFKLQLGKTYPSGELVELLKKAP